MTQRRRLDAFLLDAARERGVEVREGHDDRRARAAPADVRRRRGRRERHDGARRSGSAAASSTASRYEGNVAYGVVDRDRYARRAVVELADIPGGYGWVFPKGDHVNVGVGAWQSEGPRIREHLARVCEAHGLDAGELDEPARPPPAAAPRRRRGSPASARCSSATRPA